jgi:hypothetical protein
MTKITFSNPGLFWALYRSNITVWYAIYFSIFSGFCKKCLENANTTYEDCIKFYHKIVSSEKELKHCEDVKKDLSLKCPQVCHGIRGFVFNFNNKYVIYLLEIYTLCFFSIIHKFTLSLLLLQREDQNTRTIYVFEWQILGLGQYFLFKNAFFLFH